jgi:NAD(P)-dependent dehydrogenase (short-subunit alcohol dehydrogenase family)
VVAEVEQQVGPINIRMNNARYGYEGAIKEAKLADIGAQFDVNVFGAISVFKRFCPICAAAVGVTF